MWSFIWNDKQKRRRQSRHGRYAVLPKSCLKTTVAKLEGTSWVSTLQLALWDNIFGPRIEQIWHGVEEVAEEIQLSAARHSLSGELGQEEKLEDRTETKFHVFAEMGFIMTATLFTARFRNSITKFSLCLLVPLPHMARYLLLHPIVEDRMFHLVTSLKALMNKTKDTRALSKFSKLLPAFMQNLDQLHNSGLGSVDLSKTFLAMPSIFDRDFVARAITSHLQTCHTTVVLGSHLQSVNAFVDSLSLFLSPNEARLSAHARKDRGYVPDLVLQGVVAQDIADNAVIWSRFPTTLVDLDRQVVKQTHPYHQYAVLRCDYMDLQLQHILSPDPKRSTWAPQEGLLRIVSEPSPYVAQLLDEVWALPLSTREGFIAQSLRLLTRKAVLLIKYVEFELTRHNSVDTKRLRIELGLISESDFLILLSIAEKLSPGIFVTLAGDPAALEIKFIELFESF